MRKFRDADDVTDAIGYASMERGPDAALTIIRSLLEDESSRPAGVTRADLLVDLGEYLSLAGDEVAAGEALRKAIADGGETFVDARAWLLSWCLRNGERDEADELARELRRTRSTDANLYETVGEAFEMFGDLTAATAWFTSGLRRGVSDFGYEQLALGRLRVRQEQGFPPDEDDEFALDVLAERRADSRL